MIIKKNKMKSPSLNDGASENTNIFLDGSYGISK